MKDDEKRAPQGLIDSQDRIAQDLACVKCRQNLRARQLNDDCPACGHPILDSVFGDYLIRQTTVSVMRLADAVRVVVYGSGVLGGLISLALISGLAGARDFRWAMDTAFELLLAGGLIFPLVAIVGVMLLRTQRPLAYYKAHYLNPRRLRRWAVVLVPLLAIAATGTYYNSSVMADLGKVLWVVIPPAVFLRRLERLMCDLPNFRLARLALQRGADVLQLHTDYTRPDFQAASPQERMAWLAADAQAAVEVGRAQRGYSRLILIAKSIGTLALAHLVTQEACADAATIWLTPLLRRPYLVEAATDRLQIHR